MIQAHEVSQDHHHAPLMVFSRYEKASPEYLGAFLEDQWSKTESNENLLLSSVLDTSLEFLGKSLQAPPFHSPLKRYADDFVILVNCQKAGERVMASLRRFIESKLKLIVNEKKSRVVPSGESEFLGFTFARKKIRWTEKTLHKFKTRIRELTKRNWGVSIEKRLKSLLCIDVYVFFILLPIMTKSSTF